METNKTKKGGGLIIAAIFAVFLLVAFLFVVYPLAIIAVIIALIVGIIVYKSLVKLKQGVVVDKTIVPEHQEERQRSAGTNTNEWRTFIETVPEAYYLTIKGERGGKERTQLFEVPQSIYRAVVIGAETEVSADFQLQLAPIERKFQKWVGKTEEEARKEGLDREAEFNASGAEKAAVEIAAEEQARQHINPGAEVAKKTNFNIFSIIGVGLNLYLVYLFLRLWISPQYDDIELIYSLSLLMAFEFILVHSGVAMAALATYRFREVWKWWIGLVLFYGMFALIFNTFIDSNQILIVYGAVILNRLLSKMGTSKEQKEVNFGMSAVYAILWFFLILIVALAQNSIPQLGLTDEFLRATDWNNLNRGINVGAHVMMAFGALYYLLLTLVDLTLGRGGESAKIEEQKPLPEEVEMEEYFKKRR